MDKFQDFFRIPSARAAWWNYDSPAVYFITICSAYRECLFGSIANDEVQLSVYGMIVLEEWAKSFDIRSELFCDAFVIMPNHIHAILQIILNDEDDWNKDENGFQRDTSNISLYPELTDSIDNHGVAYRPPKSISSFVAGFKSAATAKINDFRRMPGTAVWQTRFHDHIIRDEIEYLKISRYIQSNPKNWKEDKYFG